MARFAAPVNFSSYEQATWETGKEGCYLGDEQFRDF